MFVFFVIKTTREPDEGKCGNSTPNCVSSYRKYLQLVMVKCNDMKWSLPCVTLHLLGSLL